MLPSGIAVAALRAHGQCPDFLAATPARIPGNREFSAAMLHDLNVAKTANAIAGVVNQSLLPMAKSPFVTAIPLTATNKNSCPYPSMNS